MQTRHFEFHNYAHTLLHSYWGKHSGAGADLGTASRPATVSTSRKRFSKRKGKKRTKINTYTNVRGRKDGGSRIVRCGALHYTQGESQ